MQTYTLTLSFVSLLRNKYSFAQHFAIQHVVQRVGGSFERVRSRNMRLQDALGQPAHQFLEVFRIALRFALGKRAPEDAHNRAALEQRQVQWDARDFAACEAHYQETTFPGHAAQRWL